MSYKAAIDHLNALAAELHTPPNTPQRKFRLSDMRQLLTALGEPHHRFPAILIAGTNGKGSAAATLASILTAAGHRTGLYTSPHLARPNERIQIDRHPIPDEAFGHLYFTVESAARTLVDSGQLPAMPSYFETITAMAFHYFAGAPPATQQSGCPILPALGEGWVREASALPNRQASVLADRPVGIAVLEVGLGGRLDATNVVEPILSILTDISLDHTEWLGPTITHIAREKAGILRPNGVMITLPQHPEASNAIGEAATALNVRAINASAYLPIHRPNPDPHDEQPPTDHPYRNIYPLQVLGQTITVDSPLQGHHQQRNIALAIAAAVELRNLDISNRDSYTSPTIPPIRNHDSYISPKDPPHSSKFSPISNSDSYNSPANRPQEAESAAIGNRNSYNISPTAIETGIRTTVWPARLELISAQSPRHADILLDAAHNPAGAWAVRAALSALVALSELKDQRPRPLTLVFGCLQDKAIDEMAQILFPLFDRVVLTTVDSPRAASIEDMLAAAAPTGAIVEVAPNPTAALELAFNLTPAPHRGKPGVILVTGSVYLVGAVRTILLSTAPAQETIASDTP